MLDAEQGTALDDAVDGAVGWLTGRALPFWSTVGVDGRHGFVEHMTLDARPAPVEFKRLRVQARQIYVFSHAAVNGFGPGLDAAANGWAFMRDNGWIPGTGWARVLGRHGGVLDPTSDLYDHAFALLAIAWWVRASGEDEMIWGERTLEAIERRLAATEAPGWRSEEGPEGELLQNPHMHLLEACLAAYDVSGSAIFIEWARRIIELFRTYLFDPRTGTLAEHFDSAWTRRPGPGGCVVEPGHHYEWVWLLCWASRWIPDADRDVETLFGFAERFGCDPATGLVLDQVRDDGSPLKESFRLWPNTEALKAHLARFERGAALDRPRVRQIITNLMTYYVGAPAPATWIDQLDPQRRPAVDKIPTSSLYHLHLAIAELDRLGPALVTP